MVKCVIFDFDGTLVDSKKAFVSSWNKLAKNFHFKELKLDEFDQMKKLSLRERSKFLDFKMYMAPILAPKMYKLYRESIHEVVLFDGIKDMLHGLERKGYRIVILSSNTEDNITTILRKNKVKNITDVLCTRSIFAKDKLINKFLRDNHLDSSEVMYVGDEKRDIMACKRAGVKIIWVDWGYDSIEVVEGTSPDFQVQRPEEILTIV